MITEFKIIEDFFAQLNESLSKKVNIYVIGGAALLKRGLKPVTKDIDLVVTTKSEFIELQNCLKQLKFKTLIPGREYSHFNLSQIFVRDDFRIDLFEKEVCGRFTLSEYMQKRAQKTVELSKVTLYLCSNEDILLFKTMTQREGDITDCESIASLQNPDWNIILDELKGQIKQSKQDVWVTWVGERLDLLVDRGMDIPIMSEIDILRENFLEDFERRHPN